MANFCFSFISKEDVLKEITILYTSKAIQESNIPAKMIKENGDFFFQKWHSGYIPSFIKGEVDGFQEFEKHQ